MPRQPRFELPGQPQYIIQRGNNKKKIFNSERDYRFYLAKLEEKCLEHRLNIHAYVLMPTHTHILATPKTDKCISKVLHSLGRCYAQYYNHINNRTGTLFDGRYKASLVECNNYVLYCYQYIELNPVRSGLVAFPSEYMWSSHQHNALGIDNKLITPHRKYISLADTASRRILKYKDLFKEPLSDETTNEIINATNKSWALGCNSFKKTMEEILKRRSSPKSRGGDRKSKNWNIKSTL